MNIKKLSYITITILVISCGGGGSSSTSNGSSNNNSNTNSNTNNNSEEPILIEKLVGTPFESFTIGDEFNDCIFIEGEYLTETVEENDLPIPVFAVFFTESEEEAIRDAIDIANDAMRPTEDDPLIGISEDVLVFVNEWVVNARVIIKVDDGFGNGSNIHTLGQASTLGYFFDIGGFRDTYITDWEIRLSSSIDIEDLTLITVHELGHALGIVGHRLINYDQEDSISELEENSVMNGTVLGSELNNYNFMMRHQAENLVNNFGEAFLSESGTCAGRDNNE